MDEIPVFEDFQKIIKRIEEVLQKKPADIFVKESAVKRFEFGFDLAWKSVKEFARQEGALKEEEECFSPRSCFKAAKRLGLLEDVEPWYEMIKGRNEATHIYEESMASDIYNKLPEYLKLLRRLEESLRKRYGENERG